MSRTYDRVVVTTEVHLSRDADGRVWTSLPTISYEQLSRYLTIGEEVVLVGRVRPGVAQAAGPFADGPGVRVHAVPWYHGFRDLAVTLPRVLASFLRLPGGRSLYVGRIPETQSLLLYATSRLKRRPFLSFLVADPLLALPRPGRFDKLKKHLTDAITSRSVGVIYVTDHWLQERYPVPPAIPTLARSNVTLPDDAFFERTDWAQRGPVAELVTIGTMGGYTKGQDFLIGCLAALRLEGVTPHLTLVGDGPVRATLEQLARDRGVTDQVSFAGATADASDNWPRLDAADVFVFGSRTEGLPRAVIEAMARSLPVVTTNAGGVSELLDPADVTPIDDTAAFCGRLRSLLADESLRADRGRGNFARARTIQAATAEPIIRDFLSRL